MVKMRVCSWNILAPVWADPSYYPAICVPHLQKDVRRRLIAKHMQAIDADVLLLTEVEEAELVAIREIDDIDATYDFHFMPFPETYWSNWLTDRTDNKPVPNGICIALRKGLFVDVEANQVLLDPDDIKNVPTYSRGDHALVVSCRPHAIEAQGKKFVFVCSHLDADSQDLATRFGYC